MESTGQKGANKERTSEPLAQLNAVTQSAAPGSHQKNLLTSQQPKQSHVSDISS